MSASAISMAEAHQIFVFDHVCEAPMSPDVRILAICICLQRFLGPSRGDSSAAPHSAPEYGCSFRKFH